MTVGMGFQELIVLVLYFVPTAVAYFRKHRNQNAIAMLNLFLGWTFLGWIAALIWSVTAIDPEKRLPPVDL